MSHNQTIDGVSRELLVRLCNFHATDWEDIEPEIKELRALLDADKVNNRQMGLMQFVEAHSLKTAAHCEGTGRLPADHRHGEPSHWANLAGQTITADLKAYNLKSGGAPAAASAAYSIPLYRHQPAQPQGEPVAWQIRTKTNRDGSTWTEWTQCNEMERALHSHEAGKFNRFGVMREIRPVYAEQPAQVAVDEIAEFSKWTHEVKAESRISGVTLKVQRMQHLTPGEEKSAHDAWMARAALTTKSR